MPSFHNVKFGWYVEKISKMEERLLKVNFVA